jgi:hypothetical protein
MKTKDLILENYADIWTVQWDSPKSGSRFWWDGRTWQSEIHAARTYPEVEARRLATEMIKRNPSLEGSVGVYQLPIETYRAPFGPPRSRPLPVGTKGTFGEA